MGKEETYKDRLEQEGRDEDLFAPKKREPRGFVLHERGSQPAEEGPESEGSVAQSETRLEKDEDDESERKAA